MKSDQKSGQEGKWENSRSGTGHFEQMREMMKQCLEGRAGSTDCAAMMERVKEVFRGEGKGDLPDFSEMMKGMNMESCCGPPAEDP